MEKLTKDCIDIVYTDEMAKAKKGFQINMRVDEDDLALIKAKADRLGWNVSQFIKAAALNAEFTVHMQEQLRKPKL